MSGEMIERVAKAMWERTHDGRWEDRGDGQDMSREIHLEDARAAIEAMQDPTKDMIEQFEWHKAQEAADFYWTWMIAMALGRAHGPPVGGDSVTVELPEAQKTL